MISMREKKIETDKEEWREKGESGNKRERKGEKAREIKLK